MENNNEVTELDGVTFNTDVTEPVINEDKGEEIVTEDTTEPTNEPTE